MRSDGLRLKAKGHKALAEAIYDKLDESGAL